MQISGVTRLTLLDFPERSAAICFTPGCNFRCGYCHNSEFVLPEKIQKLQTNFIPQEAFFRFLESRKNLLDGVVISGGEPTLQPDLPDFLRQIRQLGFQTKLDTNGSNPEVLEQLIAADLLDYVALDVKASPQKYADLVGCDAAGSVAASLQILRGKVAFEVRTTLVRELHDESEFLQILEFVRGVPDLFLQNFRTEGSVLDPQFLNFHGLSTAELEHFQKLAEDFIGRCQIRS